MRYVFAVLLLATFSGCSKGGSSSAASSSASLIQSYDATKSSYQVEYSYPVGADPSQIDFVELREVDLEVYAAEEVGSCEVGIPVKRWNGPFESNFVVKGFYLAGRTNKFRYAFCTHAKDGTVSGLVDTVIVSPAAANIGAMAAGPSYTATKLTSGKYFSCVLFSNGRIKCWGNNQYGQLGLGNTSNRGDAANEMGASLPYVDLGTDNKNKPLLAIDISAGSDHVCAVLASGAIKCWGRNQSGQLGLGDTLTRGDAANEMGNNLPFVNLGTNLTAKIVSAGANFSCAVLNTGGLKCWGDNDYGHLGLGDTNHRGDQTNEMGNNLPFVNLGSGRTIKAVSGGLEHTCAILDNNMVKCWGLNDIGQLGLGDTLTRGTASNQMGDNLDYVDLGTTLLFFPTWATDISAGTSHTCVTTWLYQLKCWGDNYDGQLGLGLNIDSIGDQPNQMGNALDIVDFGPFILSLAQPVTKMQVGFFTTCAQLWTSEIKCWGANSYGQLGLGSSQTRIGKLAADLGVRLPSVNIGDGEYLKMFSSQWGTTCVITQDSLVKCWGINERGALGYGDTIYRGGSASQMGANLPYVSL